MFKWLAVSAGILIAMTIGGLVFYCRSPVLVVTDATFIELYGKGRIRRQGITSSLALFRRVRPVITADGASPDIQVEAISEASSRPFCVLFPAYLAPAAERFHLQFPEIRTVVLSGFDSVSGLPRPDGVLCVYRTDQETDLYRAGLFAGLISLKKSAPDAKKTSFLWQGRYRYLQAAEREIFSRGLRESDPEVAAFFINYASEMPGLEGISCVVLGHLVAEYMDNNAQIPVILFTWLDPSMIPAETVAVFDDSTWALVVPAVRMASNSQAEGKIPSKPLLFSGKKADNGIDQILKKLAKKMP